MSAEAEPEAEPEPEETLFSCVGGWISDDQIVYLFNEDGTGEQILSYQKGKGQRASFVPYSRIACDWEEDSIRIDVSSEEEDDVFFKKIEDDLEVIVAGGAELYRMSDRDLKEYEALELPDYSEEVAAAVAEEASDSVDLKEAVIIDDEILTVRAMKFIWMNDTEPCVSFEMTNNCDREIAFGFLDTYLGDVQVTQTYYGGVMDLQPGKKGTYQLSFYINGADGKEYAESLEDLYELNGNFSVWLFTEDGTRTDWGNYRQTAFDLRPLKKAGK